MPTGQADNTVTFSFDGPKHQPTDTAALQAAIETELGEPAIAPAEESAKAPAATPAATATPEATTPPAAASAPPASPEDLKTYKITVDGQELEVTEADLKAGHMRQRDYTQKTQRIAARERELEQKEHAWTQEQAAVRDELSRIDQFLKDQNAIDAYYEKAFGTRRGQPLPMPRIDPNQPISLEQVAQIAAYNAEQVRQSMQRETLLARQESLKAAQAAAAIASAGQREKLETAIDSHLTSILDKYPVLKKFDAIDEELYADAARFAPKSLEEARARLTEAADRKMATIKAITADEQKAAAVAAAKLKRTGTELPGGTAPPRPTAKRISMDDKDRKSRLAAAEADVQAWLDAQG